MNPPISVDVARRSVSNSKHRGVGIVLYSDYRSHFQDQCLFLAPIKIEVKPKFARV